jgi:hypothetical protein
MRFASKVISFTPGFSPVEKHFNSAETVGNGFYQCLSSDTGLKPGVNETTFRAKLQK